MADRLKFRSGGVTVELDDIGSALLQRVLDQVAPGIVERIETKTRAVREQAEREWPVGRTDRNYLARNPDKRGRPHSRDMFQHEVAVRESGDNYEVVGRIWNTADYWRFIKARKLRGGSAIVAFVRKPMEKARDDLRDELPELLPRGLRRG